MKLFEALAQRKALQTELAELITLRQETFQHAEDEEPELNYTETSRKISAIIDDLRSLKLRIIKSNLGTELPNGMSLAEGVIAVADVRNEITNLRQLSQRDRLFGHSRTAKTDLKMVPQASRIKVLDEIRTLNEGKVQLDKWIAEANQSVEV